MIYDNIRTICEKKNISIKQVERELGFSNSSICKWNECEPSVWKVQKVADYLGVTMEYLLSDQKPGTCMLPAKSIERGGYQWKQKSRKKTKRKKNI